MEELEKEYYSRKFMRFGDSLEPVRGAEFSVTFDSSSFHYRRYQGRLTLCCQVRGSLFKEMDILKDENGGIKIKVYFSSLVPVRKYFLEFGIDIGFEQPQDRAGCSFYESSPETTKKLYQLILKYHKFSDKDSRFINDVIGRL